MFNNFTFISTRGRSVPDYFFCPLSEINLCKEVKVLPVSEITNFFRLQPPRYLPDHSIMIATFFTSHFTTESGFNNINLANPIINPKNPNKKPPKKNIKKMKDDFLLSQETFQQILGTIERIENCTKNQTEINRLWSEIKTIFLEELNTLPSLPSSDKKLNKKVQNSTTILE